MTNAKTISWWCCLAIVLLCGCASRVQAQGFFQNRCWQPQPARQVEKIKLNVVVPRNGSAGYERFRYRLRTDTRFRDRVGQPSIWFVDQFSPAWQRHIQSKGTPYFYYDSPNSSISGFENDTGFLDRLEGVTPEGRSRLERQLIEEKARKELAQQEAENQRLKRGLAEADAAKERHLRELAQQEAQKQLQQREQEKADEAAFYETEERRQAQEQLQQEEQHEAEEEEEVKPSLRERINPVIRGGAKAAGKAFLGYSWNQIAAMLGIAAAGSPFAAAGIWLLSKGAGAIWNRAASKKKQTP